MNIGEPLIEALRLGTPLTVEMAASSSERRSWVTILPQRVELDELAQREGWKPSIPDRPFVVRWREYSRKHIEEDWDTCPGDGMWDMKRADVLGEQALNDVLRAWSVPTGALGYLWNSDVPE